MDEVPPAYAPTYHGFWPVLLLGLSLLFILGWEIQINVYARQAAQQSLEQQARPVEQAEKVQSGLEKLVRGLVDLARTDDEAKKLVDKFGIKLNNPTVPTSTPVP